MAQAESGGDGDRWRFEIAMGRVLAAVRDAKPRDMPGLIGIAPADPADRARYASRC